MHKDLYGHKLKGLRLSAQEIKGKAGCVFYHNMMAQAIRSRIKSHKNFCDQEMTRAVSILITAC